MATFLGAAGSNTVTGSTAAIDTIDYSAFVRAVNVNLAAGTSTVTTASSGQLTTDASMLNGENGYSAFALLTAGTVQPSANVFNTLNGATHTLQGAFDGMGAMSLDADTVRVFINHELTSTGGQAYLVDAGGGNTLSLTGSRVTYVDINKTSFAIEDSGIAYDTIRDATGAIVTSGAQMLTLTQSAQSGGLSRFCSSTMFEANAFGAGTGVGDRMYFTGQEGGGFGFMLDVSAGEMWAVGAFGNGHWENIAQVNTGDASKVAFVLDSDRQDAPLYLYVGTKHAGGDFLDRNGLRDGQLYYWKADNGDTNQTEFTTGTRAGTWVAIDVKDAGGNYKTDAQLDAEAALGGGFKFNRPEDNTTADGVTVAFATTGGTTDPGGAILTMQMDFTNLAAPKGTAKVIYDGDADATRALRNPDNMVWSADGFIYVQENRAALDYWGATAKDASILKLNPATGAVTRVAEVDRGAVPVGYTDPTAATKGLWEGSGIIDVSALFGKAAGSLFLSNVMAGSIGVAPETAGTPDQDSQLVLIAASGAGVAPSIDIDTFISIENVRGTNLADRIGGNAANNKIEGLSGADMLTGLAGNDTLDGGAGNDTVSGGEGNDTIVGGLNDDRVFGANGNDKLDGSAGADRLDGGAGNDTYVVDATTDVVIDASGVDVIQSYLSRSLGTGIESLVLLGIAGNTGVGNSLANTITGNIGNNVLKGNEGNDTIYGGAGNDKIYGGLGADRLGGSTGADTFVFDTALSGGKDTILDFVHLTDKIHLSKAIFTNILVNTTLTSGQFHVGIVAHDADDRIIYDKVSGTISYDRDGTGAAASVQFAVLSTHPTNITNADFVLIL